MHNQYEGQSSSGNFKSVHAFVYLGAAEYGVRAVARTAPDLENQSKSDTAAQGLATYAFLICGCHGPTLECVMHMHYISEDI